MQNTNNILKASLTSGLVKGLSGFAWMLKILLPISFLTFLLAWSGWINSLDFILEPVMKVIGLPPIAAIPLIAGLLTGPYGAIAAMAPLPLTINQMTLLAIFLLISHNLIQEGVIQSKSGFSFFMATLFRLIASISIGINHSMVEDPVLFLSLGLGLFWMCVPRLVAAIIAVQLFILSFCSKCLFWYCPIPFFRCCLKCSTVPCGGVHPLR